LTGGFPRPAGADPLITQTFELKPGKNAIFLEVQPEELDPETGEPQSAAPATVFGGLPVESVWSWIERDSPVQFIQDPDEEPWGESRWNVYFKSEEKAFLTNLSAIHANRAYLLKITGDETVTLEVAGRPVARDLKWVPDSFNLVGFRVNPEAPPTFTGFLGPSRAHAGQAVYRLGDQGWEFIEDLSATTISSGEAYWVYSEGGSTYQGPIEVGLPGRDTVDFGSSLNELNLTFRNVSESAQTVTLQLQESANWLAYREFDAAQGAFIWPDFEDLPPFTVAPGVTASLRIGVRRGRLSAGVNAAVLVVTDDAGGRTRIAVTAEDGEL
jgi:hypothetical protein